MGFRVGYGPGFISSCDRCHGRSWNILERLNPIGCDCRCADNSPSQGEINTALNRLTQTNIERCTHRPAIKEIRIIGNRCRFLILVTHETVPLMIGATFVPKKSS